MLGTRAWMELASATEAVAWLQERVSGRLCLDSRQVQPGDGFIAWPGHARDARAYVRQALDAGAVACLVEREGLEGWAEDWSGDAAAEAAVAALGGLKAASGPIVSAFLDHPARHLNVVAITGTNGKTSTAWWTAQALGAMGHRCGVVGTLGIGEPPVEGRAPGAALMGTGLTTPDPVQLHEGLQRLVDAGAVACAIEASSIGIVEHRLDGLPVRVAAFTNLTQDHLDYHGSMAAYWAAKRVLFRWPGLRAAVVNVDDAHGAALVGELADREELDLWSYGVQRPARLQARDIGYLDGGLCFALVESGREVLPVRTRLIGAYNVLNLLAVAASLRALGLEPASVAAALSTLSPVPGRLQCEGEPGAPLAVIDYAHTPDALEKALAAVRPLAQQRGGRLHCVFGCGGNRDASKRPLMGAAAHAGADRLVITSDNPRHEDPAQILAHIRAGVPAAADARVDVIEDRAQAIARALALAGDADVVLIAGKGHEDYQDVAGRKLPFDDAVHARAALQQRRADRSAS